MNALDNNQCSTWNWKIGRLHSFLGEICFEISKLDELGIWIQNGTSMKQRRLDSKWNDYRHAVKITVSSNYTCCSIWIVSHSDRYAFLSLFGGGFQIDIVIANWFHFGESGREKMFMLCTCRINVDAIIIFMLFWNRFHLFSWFHISK